MTTWIENRDRISELWPTWASEQAAGMIGWLDDRFSMLEQETLRKAIDENREQRAAVPDFKTIKNRYSQIKQAMSERMPAISSGELEAARRNRLEVLRGVKESNDQIFYGAREYARSTQCVELNQDSRSDDPAQWPDSMTHVACRFLEACGELEFKRYGEQNQYG